MEEEPQLSTQIINENEAGGGGGGDEEFYEKIEAPKFVDFTVPDLTHPNDRYWFCLRVGCDQKHEEEMDPEAIYKNFVLRVMAARSPNIRLQKALHRKVPSTNIKCPLSAPAKPSKSRVSRLALMSSISRKMVDAKGKVKPLPKVNATPNAKAKQVAAKYLTTPRNKKCLPNPNSFRSVQNPKPTTLAVPKNRIVAKTLVFHSPKKAVTVKTSLELRTPLTKICEGMKRLQIASQRKRVLGYSNKSSKDIRRDPNKSLPLDHSGRQLSACKDKSRAKDCLPPPSCKGQEVKSLKCMKRKSKGNLNKHCSYMSKEMVENDSSDMEIDVKSRDGSALGSSRINEGNGHEGLTTVKTSGNLDSIGLTQEEAIPSTEDLPSTENSDAVLSDDSREAPSSTEISDAVLSDDSGGEMNTLSNSEERDVEGNDLQKVQALKGEGGGEGSEGNEEEEQMKSSSKHRGSSKDHPTEYQTLEGAEHESEVIHSDDKENASASDDNRNFNQNNQHGRKTLGRQETHQSAKKIARTMDKNLKEGLPSAGTCAQGVKYKKPKPTNPKPFRLRTDERGILKEKANLERKFQFLAPQKEVATVSRFPGGSSQRKHGNDIQRNEKCLEQSKCNNDMHEGSEKELEENLQNEEPQRIRTAGLKILKGQVGSNLATVTPQRRSALTHQKSIPVISQLEYGKNNVCQKSENNLRKAKSPSLQRQLVRPKGVASTKKPMVSYMTPGQQLSAIEETSSTISKPKEAGNLKEIGAPTATKATTCAATRSSSRGRRPATIPKEPNFHSVHIPKSCTMKAA